MHWIFVTVMFSVLFICIAIVAVKKTPRSALWCGAILAIFALGASLLAPLMLSPLAGPERVQYVVNSLLIMASVGANFFAGSICFYLKDKNNPKAPNLVRTGGSSYSDTKAKNPLYPVFLIGFGIFSIIINGLAYRSRK